jgi:hypothetical protein
MLLKRFDLQNCQALQVFIFGILILLRFILSSRLPSWLLPDAFHDDAWVVKHAAFILKGEWLGPYDQYTLIKGAFSPLLLAFSASIGVSFAGLNTFLYSFACIIFTVSIRPIIKNYWVLILFFALLLFNPIPYALHTGQRIYRISMGQWQILLIFGCLIGVFLRRNASWKSLLKWVFLCGLSLGSFLQTREDALWIYPFVLGSISFTVILFFREKQGPIKKIILFLLPLGIALLLTGITAITNYTRYGAPILNDRSGANFAKVTEDLLLIAPNADEDKVYQSEPYKHLYYSIYVSTMKKAFAVSPSLKSSENFILDAISEWAALEDIKNGELGTDHMQFALRDGLKHAGYYKSLPETEEFYGRVHKELQAAFESGRLVKRGFSISSLIKPIEMRDLSKALYITPIAIRDVISFNGVSSASLASIGSEIAIKKFHLISGGEYHLGSQIIGSGWAFAHNDNTLLRAGLYDKNGKMITNISFQAGQDIFSHMSSKGFNYQNAKTSRFSFVIYGFDLESGVTLRFFDEKKNALKQIPVDGLVCGQDALMHYCIDDLKSYSPDMVYSYFVGRANIVSGWYHKTSPIFFVMAFFVYFLATILLIFEVIKKKTLKTLSAWLVMTGIVSTFILFMFSMSLITATSFNALVYWYTAPAYLMLLMFYGLSLSWLIQIAIDFRKYR